MNFRRFLSMAEPIHKTVTTYTNDAIFLEDNTEYKFENVNTLTIDAATDTLQAHILLVTGTTPNISFNTYYEFAGDDITTATAGQTWEISYLNGFAVCINWGVIV